MRKVGDLQALQEKYYDDGFRVIAIADEPPDEVEATLEEKGCKYWVGLDTEQTTLKRYAGEGGLGLPQYYLVDVEGIVVSSGLPDAEEIEAQLKRVFEPALGRDLHETLTGAQAKYEAGAAGAAWKKADPLRESEDETVAEDAEFLCEKVEAYVAWQRERIEKALARGQHAEAMGGLIVFELRFKDMEDADWATAEIKTLKKHEAIHADRFAWAKLRKAMAKEAKGVKSKGARRSVIYAYEKVTKKHGGTVAARIAEERIQALE